MKVILQSGRFHQTKAAAEIPIVPLPDIPLTIYGTTIRTAISGKPTRWVGKSLFLEYKGKEKFYGEWVSVYWVRVARN